MTEEFRCGAEKTLKIAQENGIVRAVFQVRSPSCGSGRIYDGTFSGTLIPGRGVTAQLLEENGIRILGGDRIGEL